MKSTLDDEKLKDKISPDERKRSTTSATRPSSGWTPTRPLRRRSTLTSRRRWRESAVPSLPSSTRMLEGPQMTVWEGCQEECPEGCQGGCQEVAPLLLNKEEPQDRDQPSRRWTK